MQINTSVIPSIENSRRVRLGDRTGGFFVGNRGDRWPSWLARESLGDFLDSMFILWNKEVNYSIIFSFEIWQLISIDVTVDNIVMNSISMVKQML